MKNLKSEQKKIYKGKLELCPLSGKFLNDLDTLSKMDPYCIVIFIFINFFIFFKDLIDKNWKAKIKNKDS